MLRKLISYLVIFSILFADGASCMQEGEEHEPLLLGRRLSLDDPQSHNPPDIPEVKEEEPSHPQGDNAETRDEEAPQSHIPVSSLPLPEKEEDPLPPQENPDSPALPPSEGDEEEVKLPAFLLVVKEDEEEVKLAVPEEDDAYFLTLPPDLGFQIELNPLEGDPLAEDLLIQETPSLKYLRLLGINPQTLTAEESEALDKILRVEGSWKNYVVWANLEASIHKCLFALTTNKSAVNRKKQKACCDPLWLHGGPIPLDSRAAIKRNIVSKTFGNALEEGAIDSIHTILLALLGYQIYEISTSGQWELDIGSLASFYFMDSDTVSYLGIIRTLHEYPGLFALLAVPLVYAVAKTLYNFFQLSEPTDKAVRKSIESLTNRSRKWDSVVFNVLSVIPFASSLLMFHPLKRKIISLASLILWEGRLSSQMYVRENAFTAILDAAYNRKGISKMTALESLARLTHGMHIKDLLLRPHDAEGLLDIKLGAFHALKEIYTDLPWFSLNKFRTAVLLWEIGQSPSWVVSFVEPVIKAIRAALYIYTLYGIIDVLIKYFTCPDIYLNSFSWVGGLEPYASDYSTECFTAQVAVFNTLPGQPASTLVGDLGHYHFTEPYDLDLSNKDIEGPVIAEIVEAFNRTNVPLNSLNISYNPITNSSDIARILMALPPEIINLDLSNINLNIDPEFRSPTSLHFLGLGQLTGLQSLNISNNGLYPGDIGDIGQALQTLSRLKELRLGENSDVAFLNTNITQIANSLKPSLTLLDLTGFRLTADLEGQIALGNSLAQIPTLKELYLGSTSICSADSINITLNEAVAVALAHGLSAQQNLSILDLSNNLIGSWPGKTIEEGTSFFLSSLPPSLTDLDVSNNFIGYYNIGYYYSSEVKALAQAVQQMSKLTSFKAESNEIVALGDNKLCSSPDLLKALQKKQQLTVLDLSSNSCNNTLQIRDLLQTTSNLGSLDLSNNQLTQGSLLAPVLSNLQKLTSLNLGGNNFTNADRESIWGATSFLAQSPFPLDEDLNYTSTYLKSFNSTTTYLNLSGLIPNDPTAFEIIMPQVATLFPNLTALDLSNNCIVTVADHTGIIGGIQSLITYLPRLTDLQSLRMSNAFSNAPFYDNVIAELTNFSQIIGQLTNLHTLDFSNTQCLYDGFLGKGLENVHSLTSINLANCWEADSFVWQGGVQLIQGLQAQPKLLYLDLSYDAIGGSSINIIKDPNSTLALANALNSWPQLHSLNLAYNSIGYEDPAGTSTFLEQLADLALTVNKQGRTLTVDLLDGIDSESFEWTQGAKVLQALTQQTIENACAAQICTGDPISTPTSSQPQARGLTPEVATSDATSSHDIPWYSPARWVTAWKSWWNPPTPVIDMTKPHMEDLVKLRDECDLLISRADLKTADEWYRRSLEDLREDVEKLVKNPTDVTDYAINRFYNRLKRIGRDFLKKPMLEKRSFFASSSPIDNSLQDLKNVTELTLPVTVPLLQSGPVPLALGY